MPFNTKKNWFTFNHINELNEVPLIMVLYQHKKKRNNLQISNGYFWNSVFAIDISNWTCSFVDWNSDFNKFNDRANDKDIECMNIVYIRNARGIKFAMIYLKCTTDVLSVRIRSLIKIRLLLTVYFVLWFWVPKTSKKNEVISLLFWARVFFSLF